MNTQAFIEKIKGSEISDERKEKIITLLNEDPQFSFETQEQVKDLIREDILNDMKDVLSDEDKAQIDAATADLVSELNSVEGELSEDIAMVDLEMANLDKVIQDLNKALDEKEIADIKANIAQ